MRVFLAVFHTSLTPGQLRTRRERLGGLLAEAGVELRYVNGLRDAKRAVGQLASGAKTAPVVALDDTHSLPGKARWLADLLARVGELEAPHRPRVLYVTRRGSAGGISQKLAHPIVTHYFQRDDGMQWVDKVGEAVLGLVRELEAVDSDAGEAMVAGGSDIVGASPCFIEAVEELEQIMRLPYGMVTGQPGVGKLHLIRSLWRQMAGNARMFVLPCASFFKDYYVAGARRRIGGGREDIRDLAAYLEESQNGLLLLHHVEELPTAIQEELVARMSGSAEGLDKPMRLVGVDGALVEHDVKILTTSVFSPEHLAETGRLVPDLARKLRRRHVRIPSVAERGPEDVQLICEDILKRIALRQELAVAPRMNQAVVRALGRGAWPNNVSDLLWVLEYAVRHCRGKTIAPRHLPEGCAVAASRRRPATLDEIVDQARRAAIQSALDQTGGNVARAAEMLGKDKGTIYRLMEKLGLRSRRPRRS